MADPRSASSYLNAFFNELPEDQKKKILIDRKIKQVHRQFSQCVDLFILEHVNSIYLIKEDLDRPKRKKTECNSEREKADVSRETRLVLTVYVDNSLVAAELNAQRELVVLKYRELFGLNIDEFVIKISRGAYLENHPFQKGTESEMKKFRRLTPEEEQEIDVSLSTLSDPALRASFRRVIKATKEHPLE